MKLQVIIEVNVNDPINKSEILSQLMPATKKFEESLSTLASAELTQILIPSDKIIRDNKIIEIDKVKIDVQSHLVSINNSNIAMTPIEFKLLFTLMSKRGQVQSRESLLSEVWGINPNSNTRTVDVHIKRLRDKLGNGKLIHTISGVGYIIK
jgi:DNA-binding response OmpR family regulator